VNGAAWSILALAVVAVITAVLIWYLARRVKRDLDVSPAAVAGATAALELTPGSATRLYELSSEPILLKQNDQGLRVQIEHRPMLPLMAYVGKDVSGALTEAAVRVTEQWGPRWVVLLTAHEDGSASAQRLA
jgi:hypothetical protein